MAIILDTALTDVPERYRDPERAQRLVAVVADAVERGGIVVVPAKEWEVQDLARDAGCRVAVFTTANDLTSKDTKVARAAAWVEDGCIRVECAERETELGALREGVPANAQVAAALAAFTLEEMRPHARADAGAS